MSGRSSPEDDAGGGSGGEAAALRLSVRKDLFPQSERQSPPAAPALEDLGASCVKLETDFEQSIDEIAQAKRTLPNGLLEKKHKSSKKRKRKRRGSSVDTQSDSDGAPLENGLSEEGGHRRRSPRDARSARDRTTVNHSVCGGKNLSLVSSSERARPHETDSAPQETDSDDEVLQCSVPVLRLPVGGGKPFSQFSQLSSKKKKKRERAAVVPPCSGKPRSMLGIVASRSNKKPKKFRPAATYHSQILDTHAIKIKIRKAHLQPQIPPVIINNAPQKKSKKKKAAVQAESDSSGEEYDPSHGDTAASISVAAPKPRNQSNRLRKEPATKKKRSTERSESSRSGKAECVNSSGPQSEWASTIPVPVLTRIFQHVIAAQGTLPTIIRLGRVCKLWHSVACQPVLWRHVELSPHTRDQSKTDFKLIALLEHRLALCRSLNLAHWKVSNMGCVVACLSEYCPALEELNLAGWSRLTAEHLLELVRALSKLQRLDLSLTSEMGGSGSCLSASCLAQLTQAMGARLTHISLANNMFTALQQILSSIATHCSNLQVLDISGARATSHPALVPLEALQRGCAQLRVLRAANAQIVLQHATTQMQMESAGFPCLEELSIAAGTGGSGVGEYRLDDDALERIVRGATRLKLLDLRGLTRISDSGLVRVPAWDLQHLFLGSCKVTQQSSSCLELVCEKWSHSLIEVDLAWASATTPLDAAVEALAEKGPESKLRILNLCGSSVSFEPVKKVLLKCQQLESINLSSCRALPRGMKRHYTGGELQKLKTSLDPARVKAKEEEEAKAEKETAKKEVNNKSESTNELVPERESESSQASITPVPTPVSAEPADTSSPSLMQDASTSETPKFDTPSSSGKSIASPSYKIETTPSKESIDSQSIAKVRCSPKTTNKNWNLGHFSPSVKTSADSSSTSVHEKNYAQPNFIPKPDTQSLPHGSPEVQDMPKGASSWSLEQFKTTPTHKSEVSPHGKLDGNTKPKQCSPITSVDCKPSPETAQGAKQDIKNPNHWNYGNYSPMPRQDGQYSSHNSPYSAQPSPAQPSPYSAQPSPYSTQPSPYSSQQSPYSQPSPDTSQIVKPDHQKNSGNWNLGGYSPMTKPCSQYSPHPSTHTSPDPGIGVKPDVSRVNPSKGGQFSPMSRGLSQERHHRSPYSPRPAIDSSSLYPNRKSPGAGSYSAMVRTDSHLPSVDSMPASQSTHSSFPPAAPPLPDPTALLNSADLSAATWAFGGLLQDQEARPDAWAAPGFPAACAGRPPAASSQDWGAVPGFNSLRMPADRWAALSDFQMDAASAHAAAFLEQSLGLDSLMQAGHHLLEESFGESRVD